MNTKLSLNVFMISQIKSLNSQIKKLTQLTENKQWCLPTIKLRCSLRAMTKWASFAEHLFNWENDVINSPADVVESVKDSAWSQLIKIANAFPSLLTQTI